jgi:hypothetical protein
MRGCYDGGFMIAEILDRARDAGGEQVAVG